MNNSQDFPDHRYRQVVELSLDSIKEIALDGRVRFVNAHALARVARVDAASVVGRLWASLWPKRFRPRVQQALAAAECGESQQFEAECTNADGRRQCWLVSTSPLRNADGQIEGVLAVNRDITERRQSQQALRTLNETLQARTASATRPDEHVATVTHEQASAEVQPPGIEAELDIARAAQRLAERVAERAQEGEAVGLLLAGVVHDLNNVLQTAGAAIDVVQSRGAIVEEDQKILRMAESALQQGSIMAQRLLGFARKHPYAPERVELAALVARLLPLLQQAAGNAISVEWETTTSSSAVLVDPHTLERALLNLVINARDVCGERGKVCITVERRTLANVDVAGRRGGDYVTVSVKDDGSGIAPEIRDQLFDAYFTTKPAGKGTGLGLAQVDGAVRQVDGYIEVQSVPGQGACFTLGFPAAGLPGS
ncbi:PAS domain-containing protein [Xanthomonas campestris pv. asclepiadis]|uniref:two-component system sensor histidine kinase NtrB n=1 Tax=Xanthomonas campestris TaxID=339 RepID=UPI001E3FB025|nr:PAS domain-containing sensor histidine kinase [Xanthomonas campestris]MCC4615900.1 PAS domain-containing protein [Xanthomonas campestris pv. asclepiadis]